MPRQPTGTPRGRPHGTGILGEQTRLTVRLPRALYTRLAACATARGCPRGAPQIIREALEHYLADDPTPSPPPYVRPPGALV